MQHGAKTYLTALSKLVSQIHSFLVAVMQKIAFEESFFSHFEYKIDDGNTFDMLNLILND